MLSVHCFSQENYLPLPKFNRAPSDPLSNSSAHTNSTSPPSVSSARSLLASIRTDGYSGYGKEQCVCVFVCGVFVCACYVHVSSWEGENLIRKNHISLPTFPFIPPSPTLSLSLQPVPPPFRTGRELRTYKDWTRRYSQEIWDSMTAIGPRQVLLEHQTTNVQPTIIFLVLNL